jgi:hypothetical protein
VWDSEVKHQNSGVYGDSTAVASGVSSKGETQEKKEGTRRGTLILYCNAMPWACLNTQYVPIAESVRKRNGSVEYVRVRVRVDTAALGVPED